MDIILQRKKLEEIASKGRDFSDELHDSNLNIFNLLQGGNSYFSIACAISLTWTKHARTDIEFIKLAAGFFDGNNGFTFYDAEKYQYRFGEESLYRSTIGMSEYISSVQKIIPDFEICSAKDIVKFQAKSLTKLNNSKEAGKAKGIGAWLFLGPFKIILGQETRLWDNQEIDSIILPSGIEVCRGIRKIIKAEYPVCTGFDGHYLENEEKSLLEGYTIVSIIQDLLTKIAAISNTRTIHINSAFYLFGSSDE